MLTSAGRNESSGAGHCGAVDRDAVAHKVWWRIIPFVVVLYVICILDRVNIGYAALTMNADLLIDPAIFGLLSGIFFISYVLFEVPSNQLLIRTGARLWLCRIMVSWGVISLMMAFIRTPLELGILRFLLGAAEAGFAPGVMVYLSFWFRKEELAKALAVFLMAIPLAMVIASPVSTFILTHAAWLGIAGWRWLFLLEGVPAVVFGIAILFWLSDLPRSAGWLDPGEREYLSSRLDGEKVKEETPDRIPFKRLLSAPGVPVLCLSGFLVGLFLTGLLFWIPQIVNSSGLSGSITGTGLLVMVPYALAAAVMYWWSRRSDRLNERRRHVAIAFVAAGAFLLLLSARPGPLSGFLLLSGAIAACYAAFAPFFVMTLEHFPPGLRASGVALVNTVASAGSFAGPVLFGLAVANYGSAGTSALFCLLGIAIVACAGLTIAGKGGGGAARSA